MMKREMNIFDHLNVSTTETWKTRKLSSVPQGYSNLQENCTKNQKKNTKGNNMNKANLIDRRVHRIQAHRASQKLTNTVSNG